MTHITLPRAVVEQAIEALQEAMSYMEAPTQVQPYVQTASAITTLRAALEASKEVEPVAYAARTVGGYFIYKPLDPAVALPVGMALYA